MANQLAKEAATDASKQPEDKRSTNLPEIKEASTKTQHKKWQKRRGISLYGRTYHSLIPSTQTKKYLDIPNGKSFCYILQLQTRFSGLNDYRQKLGLSDSNKCTCRESETTEHYLLHWHPIYDQHREALYLHLATRIDYIPCTTTH